ncbi:hypothetical protein [Ensifer adhaerens]|nr:hypothetical protein [Ensifer adhaerens]
MAARPNACLVVSCGQPGSRPKNICALVQALAVMTLLICRAT